MSNASASKLQQVPTMYGVCGDLGYHPSLNRHSYEIALQVLPLLAGLKRQKRFGPDTILRCITEAVGILDEKSCPEHVRSKIKEMITSLDGVVKESLKECKEAIVACNKALKVLKESAKKAEK